MGRDRTRRLYDHPVYGSPIWVVRGRRRLSEQRLLPSFTSTELRILADGHATAPHYAAIVLAKTVFPGAEVVSHIDIARARRLRARAQKAAQTRRQRRFGRPITTEEP